MDEWGKINDKSLSKKEEFYNNLTMQDITDNMHAKRICKYFEIKNLGEYHNLPLKHDKLLSANIFEYFKKMCLESYQLDPSKYF